jgi:hypothetical protein
MTIDSKVITYSIGGKEISIWREYGEEAYRKHREALEQSDSAQQSMPSSPSFSPPRSQIENSEFLAASSVLYALAQSIVTMFPQGSPPDMVKAFVLSQHLPPTAVNHIEKFFEAVVNSHAAQYDIIKASIAYLRYAAHSPAPSNTSSSNQGKKLH